LKKIGSSLTVGKCWGVGNWTPNGKYFILSDVGWGKSAITGAALNSKGNLISVAFNKNGEHKIVSKVKVGLSPEGFDISPNGLYAVVANMRRAVNILHYRL
jgi:DNA-binding beta-propeller fold protein YncE